MILVVDDDPTLVQFCKEILEAEAYEVRTAFTADDAYRMLRDAKCKGMLLDLQMPVVNSPALLMVMAAEHTRTPVIALTDNPDYEERELKQFPNVKRLLLKPFYAEDLVAAVRQHMPKA